MADTNFWTSLKNDFKEAFSFKDEKKEAAFPVGNYTGGTGRVVGVYNGEKSLGEMGPPTYLVMDYAALSIRSWQAFVESPQAMAVINKFVSWVNGNGLKLQAEPKKKMVSKVNKNLKEFSDSIEERWSVYANSKMADLSSQHTLNELGEIAYKNAILGGDVLVILRYVDDTLKIQLVDGAHVQSPILGSDWYPTTLPSGNRLINGVEINARGEHIAYYVRTPMDQINGLNNYQFERIPVKGKGTKLVSAFLVYGMEFRIDTRRGIPLLTAVLEKIKQVERYETATLGSAEEQANIAYQIIHDVTGQGENPFAERIARAYDAGTGSDLPKTNNGVELANNVQAATKRTAVNNPPGAKVETMNSNTTQLYYKDFLEKNVDVICSTVEIPPNVAMSKYDSNYSASRAAIKDWEYTLSVKRKKLALQFYQPIYNFFLEIEVLKNNIQAPGYLIAKFKGDDMMLEAYRTARWVGAPVANIDPMKEVQAERLKLGVTAEAIPLTTIEASTEVLNGGDSTHNMEQYAEEYEESKRLGIELPPEVTQTENTSV